MSEDLFSVLAAIGIIALVYRWFTTTPSPSSSPSSNGLNSAGSLTALQRRAMSLPRAQVDRLLTMFPQLTENEVRYALVVTRGGVEAVAERVLIRGGLEHPPPNFFPQPSGGSTIAGPNNSNNANNSNTITSASTSNLLKINNPSLITKFNLEAYKRDQDQAIDEKRDWNWQESKLRIDQLQLDSSPDDESKGSSSLKDRKSKIVLEARWKLLQKDKKGKSVVGN